MSKRLGFTLPLVAAAALTGGCAAMAPTYTPPQIDLPTGFAVGAGSPVMADAWWRHFDDPALDGLVNSALDANRNLRAGVERLAAARARLGVARQGYVPTGGASIAYDRRERAAIEGSGPGESVRTGFDAGWELDLFGKVANAVRGADARLGAAEATLADLRLTVAAEVARTYFEWLGAQRRGELLSAFAADQRAIVELTRTRVEAGAAAAEDESRARAQLAADEAALIAEQDRAQRLLQALAILVGETPGQWPGPQRTTLPVLALREIDVGDPASLIRRRPDVRRAERRLAAATADIGVATAALFPQVRVSGFLGYAAGDLDGVGDSGSATWSLTPTISWALFDLGRVRDNIRAHEHEALAVLAEYEQTVLRALGEAEAAFNSYGLAQRRLASLADQARHARGALSAARARYEEGAADYLGALDAARAVRQAESAFVEGLVQQRLATVTVHKALGAMPAI